MNKWLKYNVSQQTYFPQTVDSIISGKYDAIHNKLFKDAVDKAIEDNENSDIFIRQQEKTSNNCKQIKNEFVDLDKYKLIELDTTTNYLLPTKLLVLVRTNKLHKRKIIDLSKYWNYEYELSKNFFDDNNMITNKLDNWYKYNDIVGYDYIKGKATLNNRVETKQRKIDFRKISIDDEIKIDYQI